ncbi:uncharacterized protein [Blastocystis hominis]|uniref:MORN repeat-containing protein 3 n=1 Tax=Blastocystis hominis TaxID=12968 RepID=D8LV12_BLAHO|nr:uncharacterized protein [Blastocystis hominis]CBK19651.2 unnamed protein product [Blastocystis hominis]|eukprot:XP_012893699.1 uncharacterized protein [Blastocystis hominis]
MECKYKRNILDGKALLFDDNGICLLNATFVNGNIEGDVEIYDGGIPIFFGQFAQNEKNGYGYDKSHGEIVYEGYYKDGKRNGIGREYDEEGNVVADVVYVDGKKLNASVVVESGKYVMYLYNDKDQLESNGVIDESTGKYCDIVYRYHSDGTVSDICQFENGRLFRILQRFKGSEMSEFDKSGNLIYKGGYGESDDGFCREGIGTEYVLGKIVYHGDFEKGERNGNGREFEGGMCVYEGKFRNGLRDGKGRLFRKDGTLEFVGMWKEGEKVEEPVQEETEKPEVPLYPESIPSWMK